MKIHLDPLGGWSGDMFVAALLDAFPEHWPAVQETVAALRLGEASECRLVAHRDRAGLTGRRFLVAAEARGPDAPHQHDDIHAHRPGETHHHHEHGNGHRHDHRSWVSIRALIEQAPLELRVRREALAIFALLAEAEGEVHGVPADAVTFHEVGAIDSIVDIVAAGQLIACLDAALWTASPLPLGSGRVRTAHGLLPIPAPATALLLRGLDTIDDGIAGERVTPTGAALARHLLRPGGSRGDRAPRRLLRTGTGFGTRDMPGLSNCLRVLAFDPASPGAASESIFADRTLGVVTFEVDDQSAEDLAAGLDHLRAMPGVHDVIQAAVFGKKGRLATQVQLLVAPDRLDEAIGACFAETTTIGLRFHIVQGAVLPRDQGAVRVADRDLRVKTVRRPDGSRTAKAEAGDVAGERGHAKRGRLRRAAEALALQPPEEKDDRR